MNGVNQDYLDNNDNLFYYISQYDGEIRYVDDEIGHLLEEIKKLGLFEDSIIIVTSDHGEGLGGHNYYFEHGRLPYDNCSKVPLIISFPSSYGINKAVIDYPVSTIDIMPMILDYLNIEVANLKVDGESLLYLLEENKHNQYVFTESGYQTDYQKSVRNKEWKLIYAPDKRDQEIMANSEYELYNIKDDPDELNNLIGRGLEIEETLKSVLHKWMDSWRGKVKEKPQQEIRLREETKQQLKSLGYLQ